MLNTALVGELTMNVSSKLLAVALAAMVFSSALIIVNTHQSDSGIAIDVDWTDDHRLFEIEVKTDYMFERYLETGSENISEFYEFLKDNVTNGTMITGVKGNTGCSTFAADYEDGDKMFARNFDFRECQAAVVKTAPTYGYASYSTVDMTMFDYHGYETPETIAQDDAFLAVAYIPMDGINEKGVTVSINSVNGGPSIYQDSDNVPIFTTSALRLILDYADSVDSAIGLLQKYDLRSDGDFHILIGDAEGNSKTYEIIDGLSYVTETKLLTNHYLTEAGKDVKVKESSKMRFDYLSNALNDCGYVLTYEHAVELLSDVSQDDGPKHQTKWSIVYNITDRTLCVYVQMNYERYYPYSI